MPQDHDRKQHWDRVYSTRAESAVSWYQPQPEISLKLVTACKPSASTTVVDVGCGTSRLVDALLQLGVRKIDLLDVSNVALEAVRQRLQAVDADISYLIHDVTDWRPDRCYDIWHDRAVLHFLVDPSDREKYKASLLRALKPGGYFIVGSFALDGPEKCSGLPVRRDSAETLQEFLGAEFELLDACRESHKTPAGLMQEFQFCRFGKM